jgi:hypothetical protein
MLSHPPVFSLRFAFPRLCISFPHVGHFGLAPFSHSTALLLAAISSNSLARICANR